MKTDHQKYCFLLLFLTKELRGFTEKSNRKESVVILLEIMVKSKEIEKKLNETQ